MNATDIFSETNHKHIKTLFKSFLILIEDLHKEHEINFSKLKKSLPEDERLIVQADYFDEDKLKYLRKKVLDMGNEVIRSNDSDLENFTITFKF
jgi:hypothetical protein